MPLGIGSKLGPYEIVAAIGAGGMGQVFRASDTRLDRDVAVKVLPEGFAIDPERRARFEREAKAVAALTHPNIVSLFDTGTQTLDAGTPVQFVVMELLDGETLRDRLKASGAIPVRKAVEIAIQIARGLGAAHDRQLVHRDLKPENVFLTRDGQIKILDFGIAKAFVRESTDGAATATAAMGTDPGSVIGTAGYMAPEQVRGHAVDSRTDLFALGAVLYEMISGKRAFAGETAAETMTAILREDPPDIMTTRTDAPPALDRILRHCLEKNPSERFQSARDVAFALEALSGSGTAPAPPVTATMPAPAPARRGPRVVGAAVAAIALLAAGAFGAKSLWPPPPLAAPWSGVALGGPAFASTPKLSPDGRTLAFIALVGKNTQVAVMTPDSGDWAIRTPDRKSVGYVTDVEWSPRGDVIYYGLNADVPRGIFSIPSVGGPEKLVLADACLPIAVPDGTLIVTRFDSAYQPRLSRFWPDSGKLQEFPLVIPRFSQGVRVLPDGKSLVALARLAAESSSAFHLYVMDLQSGATRRLTSDAEEKGADGPAAVTPDGTGVIAAIRAGHLTRIVRFSLNDATPPHTLFTITGTVWSVEVGRDNAIFLDQVVAPLKFWRFGPSGGRGEAFANIENSPEFAVAVGIMPDGRVVIPGVPGGHRRLLIAESGRDLRGLTPEDSSGPVGVLDADTIAFVAGSRESWKIATASVSTGRISKRLEFDKGFPESLSVSRDGQTLYIGAGGTIWAQPLAGGAPRAIRAGSTAIVTPDGRRLLVKVVGTPNTRLFDVSLDGGSENEIVLKGGYQLTFDPLISASVSRDGRRMLAPLASLDNWYFLPGIIDLTTGDVRAIPVDEFADYHVVIWGPDEKSIVAGGPPTRYVMWRFQQDTK